MKRSILFFFIFLSATLSACGVIDGGYTMHLDAYTEHLTYGKNYVVLPGVMDAKASDPKFIAAAAGLDQALAGKGYVKAPDIDHADLALYLGYRVVEESHVPFDTFHKGSVWSHPGQMLSMDYSRDVVIEAVDLARLKAGDPKNVVWKIHVVSKAPTGDMAKAMPYIAAAVAKYMDTSGEVYVEVDDSFNVKPFKPTDHHHNKP
jgi:hypothetical protein